MKWVDVEQNVLDVKGPPNGGTEQTQRELDGIPLPNPLHSSSTPP